MIIWRIRLLANDYPKDPAPCKWSSGAKGHLQMIIQRIWPLANDHPEDLASCKWSSGGTGLLQMIICHPRHSNHLSQDPDSTSWTFLEQFALVVIIIILVLNIVLPQTNAGSPWNALDPVVKYISTKLENLWAFYFHPIYAIDISVFAWWIYDLVRKRKVQHYLLLHRDISWLDL